MVLKCFQEVVLVGKNQESKGVSGHRLKPKLKHLRTKPCG